MNKLDNIHHSTAHLMAAAVTKLWPKALPTIGPVIEDGFYYDFDNLKISEEDLPKIEEEMKKILPSWENSKGLKLPQMRLRKDLKTILTNLSLLMS